MRVRKDRNKVFKISATDKALTDVAPPALERHLVAKSLSRVALPLPNLRPRLPCPKATTSDQSIAASVAWARIAIVGKFRSDRKRRLTRTNACYPVVTSRQACKMSQSPAFPEKFYDFFVKRIVLSSECQVISD
jgi:hypothetical protein